jgi:hypothetical protein
LRRDYGFLPRRNRLCVFVICHVCISVSDSLYQILLSLNI